MKVDIRILKLFYIFVNNFKNFVLHLTKICFTFGKGIKDGVKTNVILADLTDPQKGIKIQF